MRYKILVLLTFGLFGCSSEKEMPEDLLTKQQMIGFLIDIHVLEGKVDLLKLKKDTSTLIFNTFEQEILKEHNIDKDIYYKSYQYYMEDVKGMNEIYTAVVDSLNFLQTTYNAKMEREKERIDAEKEEAGLKKRKLKQEVKSDLD